MKNIFLLEKNVNKVLSTGLCKVWNRSNKSVLEDETKSIYDYISSNVGYIVGFFEGACS